GGAHALSEDEELRADLRALRLAVGPGGLPGASADSLAGHRPPVLRNAHGLQSALEPGTGVDCVAQQGSVEIAAGDRGATGREFLVLRPGRGDRSAEAVQLQ